MTLDVRDQRRFLERAAAGVEQLAGLNGPGAHHLVRQALIQARARLEEPLIFRHLGRDPAGRRDLFAIGRAGEVRVVSPRCRGVWMVWALLDDEQHARTGSLLVESLVPHGSAAGEDNVRRAIRHTAAAQFRAWRVPELEAAALACSVSGGLVTMQRTSDAARVITRD